MLDTSRAQRLSLPPHLEEVVSAADVSLFWDALVSMLQHLVPHDTAFLWYDYFDFAASSVATRVFESPHQDRSAEYWETRRRHHLSPRFLEDRPGIKLHRVSDIAPADAIRDSEFYRRFMEPEGWEHGVTLSFWRRGELRATIVLYRTAQQGEVRQDECDSLLAVHPLIEAMLFRMIDEQQQQALHGAIEDFVRALPIGLILLSWELRALYVNDAGYEQALLWNHGPGRRLDAREEFSVPRQLKEACEAFRAVWLRQLASGRNPGAANFSQPVHHPQIVDLRAIVSTQHMKSVSARRPIFLIRFAGLNTRKAAAFDPTPGQLQVLAQLTPSEREVALLVMRGLSNREIARRLHREISTVKDHLYNVYGKLAVRNRTQLVGILLARDDSVL